MSNIIKAKRVIIKDSVPLNLENKEVLKKDISEKSEFKSKDDFSSKYYDFLKEKKDWQEKIKREEELLKVQKQELDLLKREIKNQEQELLEKQEHIKRVFQEERMKGFEEGHKEAYEESIKEYEKLIEEALIVKQDVLQRKQEEIKSLEPKIIELILASIEKIIFMKLSEDDDVVLKVLKETLNRFTFTEKITLKVSPKDYDIMQGAKDKIVASYFGIEDVEIKIDKSYEKGQFIIESKSGSIDPSIDEQIKNLKSEFERILKSEG